MYLLCTSNLLHYPILDKITQPRQLLSMPSSATITKLRHDSDDILSGSDSTTSKEPKFVRSQKVSFRESLNTIHELVDSKKVRIKNNDSAFWYSKSELDDMAQVVRLAYMAVNDACGDFDVVNTVQVHRKRVLSSRPEQVAETSRTLSEASFRLARLHALLLEQDIASHSGAQVSYDTLWRILQNVMPDDDESDHEKDTESMGTIDLGETTWDKDDDELLEASKMVHVFDDICEDEEALSPRHESLSRTPWGNITRPIQGLRRSDADDSGSIPRGSADGSTKDLSKKTISQDSSADCTSYSPRINADPIGLLLDVTALSMPEKNPSTSIKESSISSSNQESIAVGCGKLAPFTPPERKEALHLQSRSVVDMNFAKDASCPGATSTPSSHQESGGPASIGLGHHTQNNANSRIFKRPQSVITSELVDSDQECFLPDIKRARTAGTTDKAQGEQQTDGGSWLSADTEYQCDIAAAMISLVRWEFRAHLLPLH